MPVDVTIDGHIVTFDEQPTPEKVQQVRQKLAAKAPPPPAAAPPSAEPGFGTDLASMGLQAGVGGALTASGVGAPIAVPAAMAAGALPYAYQRGGLPSIPEGIGVAVGEMLPFAKKIPGVGPLIERAGTAIGERAGPVLGKMMSPLRRPAEQALEATGQIFDASRAAGGKIIMNPSARAGAILNRAKTIMRAGTEKRLTESTVADVAKKASSQETSDVTRTVMGGAEGAAEEGVRTTQTLTEAERSAQRQLGTEAQKTVTSRIEPMMKETLKDTISTFGFADLEKMDEKAFRQMLRTEPQRVALGIQEFERVSGQQILKPGELQQLWVSDLLHGAALRAKEGVRSAKGFVGGIGGPYVLDGEVFSKAWDKLTPADKSVFGEKGAAAFEKLMASLDRMKDAPRGVRQLSGKQVPLTAPIAAIMKVIDYIPGGRAIGATGIGAAALELAPHVLGGGVGGKAAAGVAAYQLTKRGARALVDRVLGTPEGMEWLAAGVNQMGRGLPSTLIADTMSRMLMRSPTLLASLGLPNQTPPPLPGQQAGFQMVGMPPGLPGRQ